MIYFHPWTLNPDLADEHVPYLGDLCEGGQWHAAMLRWFDGRVLRAETKMYLDSFMAVTRTRPDEDANDEASEDQLSDDELVVNASNFKEVIKTRMGAGRRASDNPNRGAAESSDDDEANDAATKSTKEAFTLAHGMWNAPARPLTDNREPSYTVDPDDLQKALADAAASQKQEQGSRTSQKDAAEPALRPGKKYSAQDVRNWLEKQKSSTDENEPRMRDAQLEMLRIICNRVCDELEESSAGVTLREPLMWMLHGLPGTGKSEVLKLCKELFLSVPFSSSSCMTDSKVVILFR